jgi:hypothetical protein
VRRQLSHSGLKLTLNHYDRGAVGAADADHLTFKNPDT